MNALRTAIRGQLGWLVGPGGSSSGAAGAPGGAAGDTGLFGPASAAWAVHRDLPAMMIGGISALLLQMLHPAALAGVWDHSEFRRDMHGRLARTARFVGVTTYGSTAAAEAAIARVRGVHAHVSGTVPGGGAYAADDPALLAWVHVAEVTSFLAAHLRYRDPLFPAWRQDRYHAEMAGLARRLGATDLPETRRAAADYLRAMRPRLRADARTRAVVQAMMTQPAPTAAAVPFQRLVLDAGADLLPRWAREQHGLHASLPTRLAIRAGAAGAGGMVRWAMG